MLQGSSVGIVFWLHNDTWKARRKRRTICFFMEKNLFINNCLSIFIIELFFSIAILSGLYNFFRKHLVYFGTFAGFKTISSLVALDISSLPMPSSGSSLFAWIFSKTAVRKPRAFASILYFPGLRPLKM